MSNLDDLLALPSLPRTIFRNAPVVLALCQVRFARQLALGNQQHLEQIQDDLADAYPFLEQARGASGQVHVSEGEPVSVTSSLPDRWVFGSEDGQWKIVLAQDFMSLETRQYADFEDFLQRLLAAVRVVTDRTRSMMVTRVGLRYINEIRIVDSVLPEVVNSDLLGPLAVPKICNFIDASRQELNLTVGEGISAAIRHGLFREGSTVSPPLDNIDLKTQFYLLDFDVYGVFDQSSAFRLSTDEIGEQTSRYHDVTSALFRWALAEDYVSQLEVR